MNVPFIKERRFEPFGKNYSTDIVYGTRISNSTIKIGDLFLNLNKEHIHVVVTLGKRVP